MSNFSLFLYANFIYSPRQHDIFQVCFTFATQISAHLCYISRITSILRENMPGYLSADVVCSEERTVFPRANYELNFEFLETHNGQGQIYGYIFAPNGGCCVYYPSNVFAKGKMFVLLQGMCTFQCSLVRLYEQTSMYFLLQQ